MKKRIISLLLVFTVIFGMLPVTAQAENDQQVSLDNSGVSVEGTNGFGTLLSEEIQQEQESAESEYSGGYSVTSLEIVDGVATVEYGTLEEAMLVVALYTEDGL